MFGRKTAGQPLHGGYKNVVGGVGPASGRGGAILAGVVEQCSVANVGTVAGEETAVGGEQDDVLGRVGGKGDNEPLFGVHLEQFAQILPFGAGFGLGQAGDRQAKGAGKAGNQQQFVRFVGQD